MTRISCVFLSYAGVVLELRGQALLSAVVVLHALHAALVALDEHELSAERPVLVPSGDFLLMRERVTVVQRRMR